MNDMIDLDGIKAIVSGIGDQISTAINIDKVKKMIPHQNILDNWYLADPINQRAETRYVCPPSMTIYTIDRFHARRVNVDVAANGLNITWSGSDIGTSKPGSGFIGQYIEHQFPDDTIVTISAIIDDELVSVTGPWPKNLNDSIYTEFGNTAIRLLREEPISEYAWFQLWTYDPDTHNVKAVKLEIGDHQTLAHQDADGNWVLNDIPPDYATELLKCQRYLQVIAPAAILGHSNMDGKIVTAFVPNPTEMRANPTLINAKLGNVYMEGKSYTPDVFTDVLLDSNGKVGYHRLHAMSTGVPNRTACQFTNTGGFISAEI